MSDTIDGGGPAFPVADSTGISPGMTLRQYAAIHLRVPQSGHAWLDDMIRKAQHNDAIAQALMGLMSSGSAINGKRDLTEHDYMPIARGFAAVLTAAQT